LAHRRLDMTGMRSGGRSNTKNCTIFLVCILLLILFLKPVSGIAIDSNNVGIPVIRESIQCTTGIARLMKFVK
jgi:hypothetical protein